MDAISNILSTVTASSAIASTSAAKSSATTATSTTDSSGESSSVRTFFSDFASNLLAQQAIDPNLNIDAAVTNNLLSPSVNYSLGGQLYTSAGLLEQYVTTQFLSQLENAQTSSSSSNSTDTTAATAGLTFFGNTGGSQTLLSLLDSYEQISLLGSSLSLLDAGLGSFNTQTSANTSTENTASTKPATTTTNPVSTSTATSSSTTGSAVGAVA
jgi:hypothetical protein